MWKLTLLLLSVVSFSSASFSQGVCSSLKANAGRDTSICAGTNFIVGAAPTAVGGLAPYSYQWTAINDTLSSTVFANPLASPYRKSTYIIRVTDANGCIARDTMVITVGTCNVVCNGATGPNLLGSMGTFSNPYITPNNSTSAACIRNGTSAAPFDNIGNPKPNQTTYVYSQTSGGLGPEGRYTFVKALGDGATANCLHNDFRGADRTGDGGYFMAINGSPNQTMFGGTFFKLDSIPVCPNTDYEFSAWLANLKTGMQSHPAGSFPNIAFFINNVIVAVSGPVGPTNGQWFNNWQKSGGTWNSANEPYANIRIDNYTFVASGNDLALDDIHFKICGPVIVSQTSRTLYCEGDEVTIRDSVACTNGQLYSWYRWQRSLDGGLSWSNVSNIESSGNNAFYPAILSPFTATPALDNSKYRLMVSLDSNSLAEANPNCIIYGGITTIRVGTAPVIEATMFDTICPGTEAVVSPKIAGGTAPFYLQWKNVQTNDSASTTTYQFPVNQPTDIILNVSDTAGCRASDTIHFEPAPILNYTKNTTNVTCNGVNNGRIRYVLNNFAAPYTYLWNNGNTSNPRNNLAAGNYRVTITDRFGCTVADTTTITQPPALSVSSTINHVACSIDNTGAIQLNVSGGASPYSFAWNNSATTSSISGINGGNYAVTISDQNSCSLIRNFVVNQSDSIVTTIATTSVSCFGASTGSATLTVSGGTAPYQYLWSNDSTTQSIQNLTSGNYTVTISDATGCTKTVTATIATVAQLNTAINKVDAACFGATGNAKVTVAGGTAPFAFAWSNGAAADSIANVSAGSFAVTVTDLNGCSVIANTTILQPDSVSLSGIATTNVLCFGNNSASISIASVAGGTAPYAFAWSNGAASQNISAIAAGSFSVTVSDARACTASRSFVITQPNAALNVSGVVANLSCFNQNNGSIDLSATGGTAPYAYIWSNAATTQSLNNIAAGNYTVTVRDANNCSVVQSFVVAQPDSFAVQTAISNVRCFSEANGRIQLTVSGSNPPYFYEWSNQANTAQTQNLTAGNYTVTISDDSNCTTIKTYNITQPSAALAATANVVNTTCNNVNDGSIQLTVNGGTTPYYYSWNTGATTNSIQQLSAGSYQATVTDANGCLTTSNSTVTQPDSLKLQAQINHVNCAGANSGSIDLQPIGGTAPYIYNWSNGKVSQDIQQLAPGSYNVQVADSRGCYATGSYSITQPQQLAIAGTPAVTNVGCFNATTGSIGLQIQGGTAPYSFAWNNGQTTAHINNLSAANYSVTITDAAQCSLVINQAITEPTNIIVNMFKTDETCFKSIDGNAHASVSGGTPPYTYLWSNGGNGRTIGNITKGNYTLTVTDANSCIVQSQAMILSPDSLNATASIKAISCSGKTDGAITLSVQGGTSPYQYQWSNGTNNANINNLPIGIYSAIVSDANGCSTAGSYAVKQPDPIQLALNKNDITCNNQNNGVINLNVNGGIPPYTYMWTNNETTTTISNLAVGNYAVTVKDANQCSKSDSTNIAEPSPITVAAIVTDANCFGEASGNIFTNSSGGVSPYNFVWNTGSTQKDLQQIAAGLYKLTVTDNNGCTRIAQATIAQPQPIQIQFAVQHNKCFGGNEGEVQAIVTGGNLPYNYKWSNGGNMPSIKTVISGDYDLDIKDLKGCKAHATATVNQPSELMATIATKGVSCTSQNSGSATVVANGGTAPYQYIWMNGNNSSAITNLPAHTVVSVDVKDANGCVINKIDTIREIPAMDIDAIIRNISCKKNDIGSISVTIENGVAPYQYLWSNGQKTSSIVASTAGNFSITVTDRNGCTITENYAVVADSGFSINTIPAQTIKLGEIVELSTNTTSSDIRSWMWTPANFDAGLDCSNCQSPNAQPKKTTSYLVRAIDTKGCEAIDTVTISVIVDHTIFTPNMFSPNGDGVNDVFEIYGNHDALKEYDIKIFNRWGEKIYQSSDPHFQWDGTYKGVPQDPGVFVYFMKVIFLDGFKPDDDGKGSITLVR